MEEELSVNSSQNPVVKDNQKKTKENNKEGRKRRIYRPQVTQGLYVEKRTMRRSNTLEYTRKPSFISDLLNY